jgi:pimeloyl-ACP methyl ester carboxylesterase
MCGGSFYIRYNHYMKLIKTKSFELAAYTQGDEGASKVALVLPGRLDTKDYAHMRSHVDFLATQGFYALCIDPPGTWESPGGIEVYTTSSYIQAVHELIEALGNRPTLLMGHSRGGSVSILAGSTNPAVVGIVVAMASYGGPSEPKPESVQTGFQIEPRDLLPGDRRGGAQRVFNLPLAYFKDGEQYSPESVLETCTKPKFLIYGTDDEFTTPDEVKEVYAKTPEPKMIKELEVEHDYRYHPEMIEEVNQATKQFVDRLVTA